jgi:hypothetical protein
MEGNTRESPTGPRALASLGKEQPTRSEKVTCWHVRSFSHQLSPRTGNLQGIFLKERSLNVIENKGPLWKTSERSWNVHENAGT